jgi:hypothetical protein
MLMFVWGDRDGLDAKEVLLQVVACIARAEYASCLAREILHVAYDFCDTCCCALALVLVEGRPQSGECGAWEALLEHVWPA